MNPDENVTPGVEGEENKPMPMPGEEAEAGKEGDEEAAGEDKPADEMPM